MPTVAPTMRIDRETSRSSGTHCARRRKTTASRAAFSQPDSDEASAMPTWASVVP